MSSDLQQRIDAALGQVLDPCSIFNRTDLSIAQMGLIRDVRVDDRTAHVRLLLTDPACIYYFQMAQEIEERLTALPEIDRVTVESTSDQLWTEDRMDPAARKALVDDRVARLKARFGDIAPAGAGRHAQSQQ